MLLGVLLSQGPDTTHDGDDDDIDDDDLLHLLLQNPFPNRPHHPSTDRRSLSSNEGAGQPTNLLSSTSLSLVNDVLSSHHHHRRLVSVWCALATQQSLYAPKVATVYVHNHILPLFVSNCYCC